MMMDVRKLSVCLVLAVLPAAGVLADTELPQGWPMVAANPQRTSWVPQEVRGHLKFEWYRHFSPHISQKTQVIAAFGTLYVSTARGLHALDADTGRTKWVYETEMPMGNSPTIAGEVAYVGCFDKKLHAINARTGQGIWTFEAGAGFHTNPLVIDGVVYAGCRDGVFYAIDAKIGKERWKYATGGPILFSAACKDGVVFFASTDAHAYALDAKTGALVWKSAKLPGSGFRSCWPVIVGERVIFVGTHNYRKGPRPGNMPSPVGGMFSQDRTILPGNTAWGTALGMTGMKGPIIGKRLDNGWIDVTQVLNHFRKKPWTRTYLILDIRNGAEREIAPMLWAADDGACNRYPPLVGSDGLLYQNMKFMWNPHWMRGHVAGWKLGSNRIWTPSSYHKAGDEPLAWSAGGNVIYWNHCSHRSAGAFDISRKPNPYNVEAIDQDSPEWKVPPQGRSHPKEPDREWIYFDYSAVNDLPEVAKHGWWHAYGYHGDRNPPIPYNGRVYYHVKNGVIAFSAKGKWPALVRADARAADVRPVISAPIDAARPRGRGRADAPTVIAGLLTHLRVQKGAWPALVRQRKYTTAAGTSPARFEWLRVACSKASAPEEAEVKRGPKGGGGEAVARAGDSELTVRISTRTPAALVKTGSGLLRLGGAVEGLAYLSSEGVETAGKQTVAGKELAAGWLLVWFGEEYHPNITAGRRDAGAGALRRYTGARLETRWTPTPALVCLQHKPKEITLDAAGVSMTFPESAGSVVVWPLYGLQKVDVGSIRDWGKGIPEAVVARARLLDRVALAWPNRANETWTFDDATGDLGITCAYDYTTIADDWNTKPLKLALLPPEVALAAWGETPIRIDGKVADLDYPVALGRMAGAADAESVTATLPGLAKLWREAPSREVPPPDANDPLRKKLIAEIDKMLSAGHLRPGWKSSGQFDNQLMQYALGEYFHNPTDTIYTLWRALPLLPEQMRPRVREYLRSEWRKFPPYAVSHVGWQDGANRDDYDMPPEAVAELKENPKDKELNPHAWRGWGIPPHNLYACWIGAELKRQAVHSSFGDAEGVLDKAEAILYRGDIGNSLPYILNLQLAGHVGYLRLAKLAGVEPRDVADVEHDLAELLVRRAALSKSPAYLRDADFEYGGYKWTVNRYLPAAGEVVFKMVSQGRTTMDPRYVHGRYHFSIDFVGMVPEVGRFLHDYAREEVRGAVETYNDRAPYWFVPWIEEFAGEGTIAPLYDVVSLFQAKAMVLRQPRSELVKYLDSPAFVRGDLFYIQNLTAALEAPRE